MADRVFGPRSVPIKGLAEGRLQSWKEIAAYLGRDARSVYRWEKTERLPVYRLQHGKRGSVYAFKSELDAWVAGRSAGSRPRERRGRRIAWAAGAAGVLLLAGCAGLAFFWRGPSRDLPVALPFSSSPGVELQPAFSPDGRQVAFAWNGEGQQNFDIYVKLVGGGPLLQLTRDPADEYSPTWSPDGALVAFLRRKDAERVTVLIAPALGGAERAVAEVALGASLDWLRPGPFLAWSRDGKWLVASGRTEASGADRLLRIAAATGAVSPLTAPPPGIYGDSGPAFSPDGGILAFSRRVSWGVSELCLLPVARDLTPAGEMKRLDTGSAWNASPAWSTDGKALIFSSGSMSSPHLATIRVSGRGGATRLSGFGDYGWQPSLARTREGAVRLVYTEHFESVNLWRQPLDRAGAASELIASARRSCDPDYSPDADRIAFLSDRSGYFEIWVAGGDGAGARQWTSLKQPSLGPPRWSPDGRRIAFTMPGRQGASIYWIDAPTAAPRAVPDSSRSGHLAWAPDGRSIYFSAEHGRATSIWSVPLTGGAAAQITTDSASRAPAVSPDGRFLFFLKLVGPDGANDLYRVPLAGGAEEKVLAFVDAYSVCRAGVAYRYYRPGPNPDGPRLQFYRFETGETAYLGGTSKPPRYGLAVTPDCRDLLYSQADYEVSDLMLVDGFK